MLNPDGITVCQNGGIFDDLTHFYMHVIPRYEGQKFRDFFTEDEEIHIKEEIKLEETKRNIIKTIKLLE